MTPSPSTTITTNTGATFATCAAIVAAIIGITEINAPAQTPLPVAGATVQMARAETARVTAPAAAAAPAQQAAFSTEQRGAIEQIVREYLLANPEILMDVSRELESRQAAQQAALAKKVIFDRKAAIFQAPSDFVVGNPKGDITVVEFFDYNCGWCKRALDEINKLTKADPKIRVVLKEMPIFGENSTFAAKAAMAATGQGKYWEFHSALMKERQVTKDNVFKIAEKVGLNVDMLKKDMENPAFDAAIKENQELAQQLGIEGTPGYLVDAKVNVGFLAADGLKDMIAEVRKAGCQVC